MPCSDQLERSQRAHSTAAVATVTSESFSPLSSSESATLATAVNVVLTTPWQEARSASASPPDREQSSLPSSSAETAAAGDARTTTTCTTTARPPGLLAQQGRAKSMTASTTSRMHYSSSRGFETDDPFGAHHAAEHVTTVKNDPARARTSEMDRSWLSFSRGALAAHEQGDWLERLGKRATTFGRWTTEHTRSDHTLGNGGGSRREVGAPHDGSGTRSHHQRRHDGDDEQSDESTDEEQSRQGLHSSSTSMANRERPIRPTRNKSSLSVFHDPFETAEDHTLDFDYTSSQPTSPTPSRPRSGPPSTPTSPRTRIHRLEPLPTAPIGMIRTQAEHEAELRGVNLDDPDVLAHQLLSAQDKLGVFSLVESVLEWPWSSSIDPKRLGQQNRQRIPSFADPRTSEPSTPRTRSLPVSRVTSHHSLSHLIDDYLLHQQNSNAMNTSRGGAARALGNPSSALMTSVKSSEWSTLETVDVLNEGAWSETGELTAYYRAKSSGNLTKLRWEQEDPKLEKNEMGRELEKRVSSAGRGGGGGGVETLIGGLGSHKGEIGSGGSGGKRGGGGEG